MSIGVKMLMCELHYMESIGLSCCMHVRWRKQQHKKQSLCHFSSSRIAIEMKEAEILYKTLASGIHQSTFKISQLEWRIVFICTLPRPNAKSKENCLDFILQINRNSCVNVQA